MVPVLNERLDRAVWLPGNPYRGYCLECERWLPLCTEEEFWTHDDPHVLPADKDPDDPVLVPLDEYDLETRPPVISEPPANQFECPRCGHEQTGYPEECEACEAPYNWSLPAE